MARGVTFELGVAGVSNWLFVVCYHSVYVADWKVLMF
jgi:hypothetical protein